MLLLAFLFGLTYITFLPLNFSDWSQLVQCRIPS
jgi:hypothetical protein